MVYREHLRIAATEASDMRPVFIEALKLIEQLHYALIDAISEELRRLRRRDINAIQALLLYNIGDRELTASELRSRGCYYGSNVTHNVKKLVDFDYLHHGRSRLDRRVVRVSLTPKGQEVHQIIAALYEKYSENVAVISGISVDEVCNMNKSLERLGCFWTDQIRYNL